MSLFEPLHIKIQNSDANDPRVSFAIRNSKGQVALFVALIFQILFVFFAAVVNVGLLVHQKINLQNSVDIAAYYAGMKQAEDLNAIAHINYQIRQSWKLLTWRYRVIGTGGADASKQPYDVQDRKMGDARNGVIMGAGNDDWINTPDFCSNYPPWKPTNSANENLCKKSSAIPGFTAPPYLGGFGNISQAIINLTNAYLEQAANACQFAGTFNYFLLSQFAVAYKFDQIVRKGMIKHLSHAMSLKKDDFLDIDGNSVREGAEKTFLANLTGPNRNSSNTKMQFLNGLGDEHCDASKDPSKAAQFLSEIYIMPGFLYRDYDCQPNSAVLQQPHPRELTPTDLPIAIQTNDPAVSNLKPYVDVLKNFTGALGPPPENYSVGFEKNPWCVAYVGIKGTASPKIAFLPFGTITLTATAFVKPFGGRIGPWYGKTWEPGAYTSKNGLPQDRVDPLLPTRIFDVTNAAANNPKDPSRAPNYSRYPGDPYGIKSRNILGYFSKALHDLSPEWRAGPSTPVPTSGSAAPNYYDYVDAWTKMPSENDNSPADPMAWNVQQQKESEMRKLEMLAILPDLFDMSYYSIEPDFYNNYLKRMRAGLFAGPKAGLNPPNTGTRGDLGSRNKAPGFEDFNILKQTLYVRDLIDTQALDATITNFLPHMLDFAKGKSGAEPMVPDNPAYHLLNSYVAKSQVDFSVDADRFGRCANTAMKDAPNSGACVSGGRTGYSVKLVSHDWLVGSHSLGDPSGGGGGNSGQLLNKPPMMNEDW